MTWLENPSSVFPLWRTHNDNTAKATWLLVHCHSGSPIENARKFMKYVDRVFNIFWPVKDFKKIYFCSYSFVSIPSRSQRTLVSMILLERSQSKLIYSLIQGLENTKLPLKVQVQILLFIDLLTLSLPCFFWVQIKHRICKNVNSVQQQCEHHH